MWKLAAIASFSVLAVVLVGAVLIIGVMVHRRKSHRRPLRGETHTGARVADTAPTRTTTKGSNQAFEATFGQESVSNSRLEVQFLLRLALRLRNPSRITSPVPGAGPHARCSAQVPFRSCSCVSACFPALVFVFCFILVLLWQQCRRYKRLCPFCPQNPLKKLPGHFTTLKDLSKSVINLGGCRPLDPVTLTQDSVPQPHLPLEMDVTEPRSDWC